MLHCKMLRSTQPHARILRVNTSAAAVMPGVVAVLTGDELPIPFGILPISQDEHALCMDKVRFVGDPVAAVAALSEEMAEEACNAITVEYEPLAPVSSIDDGINPQLPGAAQLR
jgi:CO/xanthine dehydrogenase Mo-binding subunit